MKILGISCFYHDAAACLTEDGDILAAAQEERFSRIKHDAQFPLKAISYCLHSAKTKIDDLEAVVFYDKPLLKFERILETFYSAAPGGIRPFLKGIPVWAREKLFFKKLIIDRLKKIEDFDKKSLNLLFSTHHLSHAASAFYPSPFNQAAIITIDGVGEWETLTIGMGRSSDIEMYKSLHFPDSVGLLYSAFTHFLGFKINSGEYKLMGMAPYGNENSDDYKRFFKAISQQLVNIKEDGSVKLNTDYFSFTSTLRMIPVAKWESLLGIKARTPEAELNQKHCDLALAAQNITGNIFLKLASEAKRLTGAENLCLSGGVALNCVANSAVFKSGLFKNIWIQPAAGDAGGAIGAALATYYLHFNRERKINPADGMKKALLGPEFTTQEIIDRLAGFGGQYESFSEEDIVEKAADYILSGKVTGWFQGRMEFGPRALGSRSILADARSEVMQKKLNMMIKFRESFRPFAPAVLEDDARKLFESPDCSPYMLLTSKIKKEYRKTSVEQLNAMNWQEKLSACKSSFPAITHVDFSSRLQTVTHESNPLFFRLLKKIREKSGTGIVINTSFNVRDEPIVHTPEDAYRCFMKTEMDILIAGNLIFIKEKQPWQQTEN